MSATPILIYRDVRKRFGNFEALAGVSMEVRKGQVMCLIGPSGSGKSTLLRCTNGLETIDGGEILLEGVPLARDERGLRQMRRRMGMVFQNFELFPHKTVLANVALAPRIVLSMDERAARERAEALLDKVGLADKAGSYPANLSGGQQQRVAIARALLGRGVRERPHPGAGPSRANLRRAQGRTHAGIPQSFGLGGLEKICS